MELTELLLCRGNFGFNWRPTGGRAGGAGGGGNRVTGSVFWKDQLKGESKEKKKECGLDVWKEVLHGLCM